MKARYFTVGATEENFLGGDGGIDAFDSGSFTAYSDFSGIVPVGGAPDCAGKSWVVE